MILGQYFGSFCDGVWLDEHKRLLLPGGPGSAHASDGLRLCQALVIVQVLEQIEQRRLLALVRHLQRKSGAGSYRRMDAATSPNPT